MLLKKFHLILSLINNIENFIIFKKKLEINTVNIKNEEVKNSFN